MKNLPLTIAGCEIKPGTRTVVILPTASLYTQTKIDLPIHVFHGKQAGPKIFVIAGIHGDEINSVEIIHRLHRYLDKKIVHGTVITVPVANVFGFILQSRYLPDRRDLNRSFPGSKEGSLAGRLANILIEEIVLKCNYGIDLHTGAIGRINMPQIRVNLDTPGAEDIARAFGTPVILEAKLRDGSLRQAASELGIPLLVYEGGEALRYNEVSVRVGLRGVINTLRKLGILLASRPRLIKLIEPVIAHSSFWVRAPVSGLIKSIKDITSSIIENDALAYIYDPFDLNPPTTVYSPLDGVIIGKTNLPLVNEGDALYNIASVKNLAEVNVQLQELRDELT